MRVVETPLFVPAYYEGLGFGGSYKNPTISAVEEALLDVYHHYPRYVELAREARPWVKNYTVKNLLPKCIALLHPKRVMMGDKNEVTKDGIRTNSPQLYNKLSQLLIQ